METVLIDGVTRPVGAPTAHLNHCGPVRTRGGSVAMGLFRPASQRVIRDLPCEPSPLPVPQAVKKQNAPGTPADQ